MGSVLYKISLLGHVFGEEKRLPRQNETKPPKLARLEEVERSFEARVARKTDCSPYSDRSNAHRRSGRWLWWYPERRRLISWGGWQLEGARNLELEGSSRKHKLQKAKGYTISLARFPWKEGTGSGSQRFAAARGKPRGRSHYELVRVNQSSHDAGVTKGEGRAGPPRDTHQNRMDSFRCQQVCRWPFATLPTRRLTDPSAVAAFRSGWGESTSGHVQVSPRRREPSRAAQASVRRVGQGLGTWGNAPTVPSGRLDHGHGAQAGADEGSCSPSDPRLASSSVARAGPGTGIERRAASHFGTGVLGSSPEVEPVLEDSDAGSERRVGVRASSRMSIADEAVRRIGMMEMTPGLTRATSLLKEYAWCDRTKSSRNSQWNCWVKFCEDEGRNTLPITEAHLLEVNARTRTNRRSVGHASLLQYLSAVNQMHRMVCGEEPPSFPLVSHAIRAYGKWEEDNYPKPDVRIGIPASVVQLIWGMGMSTEDPSILHDAAMVLFAFCMNGLRESSVTTIEEKCYHRGKQDDSTVVEMEREARESTSIGFIRPYW